MNRPFPSLLWLAALAAATQGAAALTRTQDPSPAPWRATRAALVAEVEDGLASGAARRAASTTAGEVRSWQARVRTRMRAAFAPLPPEDRDPPAVDVVRRLAREGYAIEHLLIESRPGMRVPAHLYLPDSARFPPPVAGVLVPCGHSAEGKAYPAYQVGAAALARHGMAALVFDPLDQGERVQALDGEGEPVRWGTRAHNLSGARAALVGWSQAGLEAWDGIRCLDALAARPEVDLARLGVCGNSGGGTQSAQLFALDDRLRAAAPSCYLTSLAHLARTIGPQDAEQNLLGQARDGIDHADYLAVRAPAPALVCAARADFFPIEGTRATVAAARGVYAALGDADALALVEVDAGHGWSRPLVEATVEWMARRLDGREIEVAWSDAVPMTPDEARVTPDGQVLFLEGERGVRALLEEEAGRAARARLELTLRDRIGRARELAGVRSLDAIEPLELRPEPRYRGVASTGVQRLRAMLPDGVELPAARRAGSARAGAPPRLVVGVGAWSAPFAAAVEAEPEVLWLDPLACGDAAPDEERWYGTSGPAGRDAALCLWLGRPLVGRQAEQILAAARALGEPVELVARGPAAVAALHSAAFEPGLFASVDVDSSLSSWSRLLLPAPDEQVAPLAVPEALRVYDLPDLVAAWDHGK